MSVRARSVKTDEPAPPTTGWRAYVGALGPGLVTGASDDDPSGIATYSQTGAQFRFSMLWASLLTLPLMAGVQEICDRTALATGKSLGELCRRRFGRIGRTVLVVLLVGLLVANTANIAADVLAIGSGMQLLHAGPASLWAPIAGVVITVLVVAGSFEKIARAFKYLCLSLLTYLIVMVVVHVPWTTVLASTVVPHIKLTGPYLALLVAVLGTTISPYLFFWQTAHRVEELEADPRGGDNAVPYKQMSVQDADAKQGRSRFDVFFGMGLSNLVMFSIIVATASTLGSHGSQTINSAAAAARALKPVAGSLSSVLFAIGFIGTGFLAIPVLAGSASTGLAGFFNKEWGFSRSVRQAPLFYVLVMVGTVGGTALSLVGVNPIRLLVIVAIINGVAAAPFLIAVMLVSNDREIMGDHCNGMLATTIGWLTVRAHEHRRHRHVRHGWRIVLTATVVEGSMCPGFASPVSAEHGRSGTCVSLRLRSRSSAHAHPGVSGDGNGVRQLLRPFLRSLPTKGVGMSTTGYVLLVVAVIVVVAALVVIARRRHEHRLQARRSEASDTRAFARISQLEADRATAEADERAAHARREQVAAEQNRVSAAAHRSTAQELQSQADAIDPDVQ